MSPSAPGTFLSAPQTTILILLAGSNLLSASTWSLQAKLYPAEAEKKKLSAAETGFVFGIYELAILLSSLIMSSMKAEPAIMYRIGYLTLGASTVLFGFLDGFEGHFIFLTLSVTLRIIAAAGSAIIFISNLAFIQIVFPASIARAFAVNETMFALGAALGPALGGILYKIGGESFGFPLPFLVLGMLIFVTNLVAYPILARTERGADGPNERTSESFELLKMSALLLYGIALTSASLGAGFIRAALESHLKQFSLDRFEVGLVFLICGVVYAVTAFLCLAEIVVHDEAILKGLICDRIPDPKCVTLGGSILVLLSFTAIGPAPFIPADSSLGLTGVSLAVFGLGMGAIYISGFCLIIREETRASTALWLTAVALGSLIGPSLGVILTDVFGFRAGTVFIVGLFIVLTLMLLVSIFVQRGTAPSKAKPEPEPESIALLPLTNLEED